MRIAEANALDRSAFVQAFGGIFEHSAWVAERAWGARPFASADALHAAMVAVVRTASREKQLALVRAHPELAGREAAAGALTPASAGEQARLGFTALTHAEFERIRGINAAYREKFGFPCIVALALHDPRESVIAEMERRTGNEAHAELEQALVQAGQIARARLGRLFEEK